MYEAYWQLTEKPFENGWDRRFYYPSETHQGALLKLRYGAENHRGAVVLSGAAGLGKSILVQSLREQLPEDFSPFVHLVFPQLPCDQLLAYLADQFAAPRTSTQTSPQTAGQSVQRIEQALAENTRQGRHAILVVDEAHLLTDSATLETLRLLLNFDLVGRPGLTLVLVGQPPLLTNLDRASALNERVGIKCLLRPLNVEETISYVQHRMNAAGAEQPVFEQPALEAIHELTHGTPQRINQLCDLALLIGFAEERHTISADAVESVFGEMEAVSPE